MRDYIRKIEYKIIQLKTYLMVDLAESVTTIPYCIRMAEKNNIAGLLPVSQQFLDGNIRLCYDISNRKKVKDAIFAADSVALEQEAIFMLKDFLESMLQLPEYFLQMEQVLLDVEYTFINENKKIQLPLVPLELNHTVSMEETTQSMKQYLMQLLGIYTSCGCEGGQIGKLLHYLIRPDFQIEGLFALLQEMTSQTSVQHPPISNHVVSCDTYAPAHTANIPISQTSPVSAPQPQVEEKAKWFSRKGTESENKSVVSQEENTPFAIPGKSAQPVVPAKSHTPQKSHKENKSASKPSKGLFSLFGKKEKAPIEMNKEKVMVAQGDLTGVAAAPLQPQAPSSNGAALSWPPAPSIPHQEDNATICIADMQTNAKGLYLQHQGKVVPVSAFPYTVGRIGCDYTISTVTVSKKHITIFEKEQSYYVQDENSRNHTYLNGTLMQPYTPYLLENGACLLLGAEEITVKIGM